MGVGSPQAELPPRYPTPLPTPGQLCLTLSRSPEADLAQAVEGRGWRSGPEA